MGSGQSCWHWSVLAVLTNLSWDSDPLPLPMPPGTPFQPRASTPFLGHAVGMLFFSPVFGFIFCWSCLDPLKGPQDWFVTLPARETCCQLPALPTPFGCCGAAPWLVKLLLLAFVSFQHLASPVKKPTASKAGKLKMLVIHLLGKTDAGHAVLLRDHYFYDYGV